MSGAKPKKMKQGEHLLEKGKATQFKPGVSGNPAGRREGTRNFKTVIKEILELVHVEGELLDINNILVPKLEVQFGRRITRREAMIYMQVMKAMSGDTQAFNALADREEGKPKQAIELDAEVDHSGRVSVKFVDIEERLKLLKGEK